MRNIRIKKVIFITAIAVTIFQSVAQAQVIIDMSRVTCADALAMTPEQSDIFFAWISGYFNQKSGYTWIDLKAFARNVVSVKAWCATYPNEFVMTGLERATGTR
jgi:hypothetical protein